MIQPDPPIRFMLGLDPRAETIAREFVAHILTRCNPAALIAHTVDFTPFDRPTHVIAFGKASIPMASACVHGLDDRFAGGIVLAPDQLIEQTGPIVGLRYLGVDHPNPTPRNMEAARELGEYARSIPESHDCIVCISGGGSAHLCAPKPGVTLQQIIQTTKNLNARGANIHELNEARRSLETLKAGGLAELLIHTHRCQALVLSDVLDDDLETIASGPMMDPKHPIKHTLVGSHRTALQAGVEFLESWGVRVHSASPNTTGEARLQGEHLADRYLEIQPTNHPAACLIAGETTVNTHGSTGIGGPTLETTLACALRLLDTDHHDWVVLGLATDGIDGPTDAAGAVITSRMLSDPNGAHRSLSEHSTLSYLDSMGATIRTGPTGTNLNDLCLVAPLDAIGAGNRGL